MPRKRHSAEEIVAKLRQADVLLSQGQTGADVARVLVWQRPATLRLAIDHRLRR